MRCCFDCFPFFGFFGFFGFFAGDAAAGGAGGRTLACTGIAGRDNKIAATSKSPIIFKSFTVVPPRNLERETSQSLSRSA